jgi:hypothetical protein
MQKMSILIFFSKCGSFLDIPNRIIYFTMKRKGAVTGFFEREILNDEY